MKRKFKCTIYSNHVQKSSFDRTIEEDYNFPGVFLEDDNLIIVSSNSLTPVGKPVTKCYAKILINNQEFKINLNIGNKNAFMINPATGNRDFSLTITEDYDYDKFKIALHADKLNKELPSKEETKKKSIKV